MWHLLACTNILCLSSYVADAFENFDPFGVFDATTSDPFADVADGQKTGGE